jgi:hypothetical protein
MAGRLESLKGGAGRETASAFGDSELAVLFATFESVFPVAAFDGGNAPDYGQVFFLDLFVAEEFVEGFGDLFLSAGDDNTGGGGVQAVVEVKFTVLPGVGLGLFVVVGCEERVVVNTWLVWMRQDACRLFDGEDAGWMFGEDSGIWMKGEHFRKGEEGKRRKGASREFTSFTLNYL